MSAAGYGYGSEDDPDEQKRNPALALQQNPALPESQLALAPEQPSGQQQPPEQGYQTAYGGPPAFAQGVDPLDPTSTAPKGGIPGGELNPEQLAQASTVPLNDQGDELDKYLAANPVPPAQREPGKQPTIQEQEQQGLTTGDQLTEQQVAAEKKAQLAREEIQKIEQHQAETQATIAAEHEQHQRQLINQANARTQAWMNRSRVEADKYSRMGMHDYFADKSTGNKILAKLSVAVGALAGKTNPGQEMLDKDIERDFRLQQAAIMKQKENVQMARTGLDDALTFKQQALADNNLKKAAAYDAVAAQGVALKLRQGVPLAQAQSDATIVGLRQKANDTRMHTLQLVHQQNIQDAMLGVQQTRANAAMTAAQARAHKGGGGGGGGGRSAAMEAFTEAANQLKPGEQITPKVMALGIKAGYKPAGVAPAVDKLRNSGAGATTAAGRAGGAGDKLITDDFKTFRDQAVGTSRTLGPVRVLSQVEAMREGYDKALKTGDPAQIKAAAVKASEQAGSLMSGGKLTNAQIKILEGMKSKLDHAVSSWSSLTGNPTEGKGFTKRLGLVIEDAGGEIAQQVGRIRENAYGQNLGAGGTADTPEKKRRFLNLSRGTFGSATWKGQRLFQESGGAGAGGNKLSNRDRALKIQAEAAVNDPRSDAETKRDAQALLDKLEEIGD